MSSRVLPLLLLGCGDPLADHAYRGEVLLTFAGSVINELPPEMLEFNIDNMHISVVWLTPAKLGGASVADVRGVETLTTFPADYEVHLYQPPPEDAIYQAPWGSEARVAVAAPVLFLDDDGDGIWDEGVEQVVGGSFDVVGVWSVDEATFFNVDTASSDSFIFVEDIPLVEGYQKMSGTVDWCGVIDSKPAAPKMLFAADDAPVNLYLGPIWDYLADWRCGPWL